MAVIRKYVISSVIKALKYDPESHNLEIEFKSGGKYRYSNVEEEEFTTFAKAVSKGKYFNKNIKNGYEYERISSLIHGGNTMNWLTRKAKAEDEVYFLVSTSCDVVEDSFEKGEISDWRNTMFEKENKKFDTIDHLVEYLYSNYGLSKDKSEYTADDGQLTTSIMQDEDGNSIGEVDNKLKQWKEGKARLWNAYYIMHIEIVKTNEITTEELRKLGFTG